MNREPAKTPSDRSRSCRDRLEVIADLLEQNLTVTEISGRVGISEWRVRRTAYDHGLTRPANAGETRLNQRQGRILAFIQDYTARHVYPPTVAGNRGGLRPEQHIGGAIQSGGSGAKGVSHTDPRGRPGHCH